MFVEDYAKLSKAEQSEFEEVINTLLLTSFVNRMSYDRHSSMMKTSRAYSFIERRFNLISDYLSYGGWELVQDSAAGVMYLSSHNDNNRIHLDIISTLVIYSLRYLYEEKIVGDATKNEIYVSSNELRQVMMDKGLFQINKRLTATTLAAPLRLLSYYNIINKANGDYTDRVFGFYIMPSIRFTISSAKMNALVEAIEKLLNGEEDAVENETEFI